MAKNKIKNAPKKSSSNSGFLKFLIENALIPQSTNKNSFFKIDKSKKELNDFEKCIKISNIWTSLATVKNVGKEGFESDWLKSMFPSITTSVVLESPDKINAIASELEQINLIPRVNTCTPVSTTTEAKLKELTSKLAIQTNGDSLKDNLMSYFIDLNIKDPNAFIWLRKKYDTGIQYLECYKCSDVVGKFYDCGALQYVVLRKKVKYKGKDNTIYTLLSEGFDVIHQITEGDNIPEQTKIEDLQKILVESDEYSETEISTIIMGGGGKKYHLQSFQSVSSIEGCFAGFVKSDYENIFNSIISTVHGKIINYILAAICWQNHLSIHGYAELNQYSIECSHEIKGGNGKNKYHHKCNGGVFNGSDCPACDGTGYSGMTKSETGVTRYKLKNIKDLEKMPDLNKVSSYRPIPKEVLEINKENFNKYCESIVPSFFGAADAGKVDFSDKQKHGSDKTATEIIAGNVQPKNRVFFKIDKAFTKKYKHLAKVAAAYEGIKDVNVYYEEIKDYNLESMALINAALSNDNLTFVSKAAYEIKLMTILYGVGSIEVSKIKIINNLNPVKYMTQVQLNSLIPTLEDNDRLLIAYTNFHPIIDELFSSDKFMDKSESEQVKDFNKKVNELVEKANVIKKSNNEKKNFIRSNK